jgi:hypothetical protein
MYTELKANTPELQAMVKEVGKANPTWGFFKIWNHIQENFPELIDPSHKPSNQALHQASVQCVGFELQDGSLIIQGAFSLPLS